MKGVVSFCEERTLSGEEVENALSRNSKIGGRSPVDGQSPEPTRESSEASEATEGCMAQYSQGHHQTAE